MAIGVVVAAVMVAVFLLVFFGVTAMRKQRESLQIDMNAIVQDEALRDAIENNKKLEAIRRYRGLSGTDLRTAKQQVEYWIENPKIMQKQKIRDLSGAAGAGIRDKVMQGQFDEAVQLYAGFMGVDKFTAEAAIQQLSRELHLDDMQDDLARLLRLGDKAGAIESYQSVTGADLAEALTVIEKLEATNNA
ncbi:MAG: hypothetical protein ACPG7F_06845 [Aggregatilineales bacterium]